MSQAIAILPERAALFIGGPQAEDFLHNLLTCDVKGLAAGSASYGALLTPQGKILFDLFLTPAEGGFLLDCGAAKIEDFLRRLMMYRLRSKVEIAARPELRIAAIWGDGPPAAGRLFFPDPRYAGMGFRTIAQTISSTAAPDLYHAHRIGLGIADGDADMGSGELFPHEANFDQLGGISFGKGCYVGQEVVSRMQHRGSGGRNRILPVTFEATAPEKGVEVLAGERKLGTVLSSSEDRALALLRLDRAEAALAAGERLLAGGQPLAITQPPWASFQAPGRGATA